LESNPISLAGKHGHYVVCKCECC